MKDFIMSGGGLVLMSMFFGANIVVAFSTKAAITRIIAVIAIASLGFAVAGHPLL